MTKFADKKKKAVNYAVQNIRKAFRESMSEIRSEIVQSIEDQNDIPKVREDFNTFQKEVSEAVKKYDIVKADNKTVTASRKKGSPNDLISLAIQMHQKGIESDAKELFAHAAVNSVDMFSDNFAVPTTVQNKCPACGIDLPPIANFCHMCGTKQDNMMTMGPSPLQPAPEEQPMLVQQPQQQQQPQYNQMFLTPVMQSVIKKLVKAGKFKEASTLIETFKSEA